MKLTAVWTTAYACLDQFCAKVVVCKPAGPEAEGLIERAHDYLERSFLPGRTFTSPADFNAQLGAWLALANTAAPGAGADTS